MLLYESKHFCIRLHHCLHIIGTTQSLNWYPLMALSTCPQKKNRVAILLIFIIPNSPFGTTFQHNATNSELPLRLPLMAPINNDESWPLSSTGDIRKTLNYQSNQTFQTTIFPTRYIGTTGPNDGAGYIFVLVPCRPASSIAIDLKWKLSLTTLMLSGLVTMFSLLRGTWAGSMLYAVGY